MKSFLLMIIQLLAGNGFVQAPKPPLVAFTNLARKWYSQAERLIEKWGSGLTYNKTEEGWLYLTDVDSQNQA
jgi:hypothetical protein